jgi:hypothetical protein
MQLAMRIRQTCRVEVPLAVLFEHASLAALADYVEQQQFAVFLGDDADDLDRLSDAELLAMLGEGDKHDE